MVFNKSGQNEFCVYISFDMNNLFIFPKCESIFLLRKFILFKFSINYTNIGFVLLLQFFTFS